MKARLWLVVRMVRGRLGPLRPSTLPVLVVVVVVVAAVCCGVAEPEAALVEPAPEELAAVALAFACCIDALMEAMCNLLLGEPKLRPPLPVPDCDERCCCC